MIEHTYLQLRARADFDGARNASPPGGELAVLLHEELAASGIAIDVPIQEDWGWCFYASVDGASCLVGCGAYLEFDDGWLVFVEPVKARWRYWFRRGTVVSACKKVAAAVCAILAADERFYDFQWWTDPAGLGPTVAASHQ